MVRARRCWCVWSCVCAGCWGCWSWPCTDCRCTASLRSESSDGSSGCRSVWSVSHTADRRTASPQCECACGCQAWSCWRTTCRTRSKEWATPRCDLPDEQSGLRGWGSVRHRSCNPGICWRCEWRHFAVVGTGWCDWGAPLDNQILLKLFWLENSMQLKPFEWNDFFLAGCFSPAQYCYPALLSLVVCHLRWNSWDCHEWHYGRETGS